MTVKIEVIHMQPKNTNSVLLESGGLAVIFDPWGRAEDWQRLLKERGLELHAIYCTHGHFDHITGIPGLVDEMRRGYNEGGPVPRSLGEGGWFLHPADSPVVEWSNQILQQLGTPPVDMEKMPPRPIQPGNMEILPGVVAEVLHLPGHSAGGVAFYFSDIKFPFAGEGVDGEARRGSGVLIVGDTLFQDCYGRTDIISASESAMRESLTALRARNFPDDTVVIHGHGPDTTIKWLKENNPFFK